MSTIVQQAAAKFLAIGTSKPMTVEQRKEYMLGEVRATLQLYLDGKIDQFWHRYDGKGVVFVMTTGSLEEADALLEALPLGVAGFSALSSFPLGHLARSSRFSKPPNHVACEAA